MARVAPTIAALAALLVLPAATHAGDAPKGVKGVKVGGPAPAVLLYYVDGNIVPPKSMEGKYLLLTFWSVASFKSTEGADLFGRMKNVRRAVAGRDDFVLVSVCVDATDDDKVEAWSQFLLGQGPWITATVGGGSLTTAGGGAAPRSRSMSPPPACSGSITTMSLLVGPDGKLLAAVIPGMDLPEAVSKTLKGAR